MSSKGRSWRTRAAALLVVGLVSAGAVGCGGGDDDDDAGGGGDLPDCPVKALDDATQPVQITFWHTMQRANETALKELTDAYNASQQKVKVKLVNNSDYDDQQDKYRAGLTTGDLPDLSLQQDIYLQQMIDTQTALPVQSCIDATDDFDADDFVGTSLAYYSVEDVEWGLPFNLSNPVLYYDKAAFRQAGLDPEKPPATFDELRTAAEKIKASGYNTGMSLKTDSWQFEQLVANQGAEMVDNGNGRKSRAEAATFDNEAGQQVFELFGGLVADGLATTTPRLGPSQFDNLIGIGTKHHGMTFDTTAALGTILDIFASGQYADVDLGVGPMPGRTDTGGAVVGGAALYISAKDPAKQAAAWDYMQYLTSPESQSKWAAATGYIPVRASATELPEVKARWAEVPGFKVAYDQLVSSADNTATQGAVIGDFEGVRDVIEDAENRMYLDKGDPDAALKQAAEKATTVIEDYNDRL
jgi:sn-glycerol 3-phosphate transport system substrate-binding protein